jgi:hypothetical protein
VFSTAVSKRQYIYYTTIAWHINLRHLTCARYFENKNPRLMITTVPRHEISLSVLPIVSMLRNTTIAIKGNEHITIFLYLKQSNINNYTRILDEEKKAHLSKYLERECKM